MRAAERRAREFVAAETLPGSDQGQPEMMANISFVEALRRLGTRWTVRPAHGSLREPRISGAEVLRIMGPRGDEPRALLRLVEPADDRGRGALVEIAEVRWLEH